MRYFIILTLFLQCYRAQKFDPKAILALNFLDSNKEVIKSSKQDPILSAALAKTFNLSTSSDPLQDDSSNNFVLMDSSVACDAGWKKSSVNGMCYKIATADTTWYAAEDWCYNQRSGSHLTSVHSQAEAQWIAATYVTNNWLLGQYMDNWIGLRRSCDNTTYVWTDGTPVDYMWWQPGYPGSKEAEKSCVTIWMTALLKLKAGFIMGQFDDIWDCGTNTATPTCRYDPTSTAPHVKYDTSYTCVETTTVLTTTTTVTTTTTTPTTTTTTPTTTTTTPTTTTTTEPTTTTVTTTTVPTTTTTTAEPTTTTVTTTPTTTTTTPTTTTTTPTTTTTVPTTTTITTTEATTTTTTPTTTTSTDPTTTPTTPTTATVTTPVAITTTKITGTTTTAPLSAPGNCSPKCGTFWISYKDECYGIVKGTSNFATAKLGCNAFGGEMAVVTDADMNEAMRLAFSTNNDSTINHQAWVGPSSYANWAPGKPNKAQGSNYTSYCNVMTLSVVNSGADFGFSRGVWTDYPCSLTQEFALCKKLD